MEEGRYHSSGQRLQLGSEVAVPINRCCNEPVNEDGLETNEKADDSETLSSVGATKASGAF